MTRRFIVIAVAGLLAALPRDSARARQQGQTMPAHESRIPVGEALDDFFSHDTHR
jgi:hypothetical protein